MEDMAGVEEENGWSDRGKGKVWEAIDMVCKDIERVHINRAKEILIKALNQQSVPQPSIQYPSPDLSSSSSLLYPPY